MSEEPGEGIYSVDELLLAAQALGNLRCVVLNPGSWGFWLLGPRHVADVMIPLCNEVAKLSRSEILTVALCLDPRSFPATITCPELDGMAELDELEKSWESQRLALQAQGYPCQVALRGYDVWEHRYCSLSWRTDVHDRRGRAMPARYYETGPPQHAQ